MPTRALGVEASAAVGRGLVAVRDSTNSVRDIPATFVLSSVKGVLVVNPGVRDGIVLHVATGPAVIARSGRAWADTRPAGVAPALAIAAGGSAALGKHTPWAFRFELEDVITRAQFNVGLATETRPLLHHDLIWSLGFSFPILGRRR